MNTASWGEGSGRGGAGGSGGASEVPLRWFRGPFARHRDSTRPAPGVLVCRHVHFSEVCVLGVRVFLYPEANSINLVYFYRIRVVF